MKTIGCLIYFCKRLEVYFYNTIYNSKYLNAFVKNLNYDMKLLFMMGHICILNEQ